MSQEPRRVGIDVSKATLDVGLRPTVQTWSVPNDENGIGELLRQLGELSESVANRMNRSGCPGWTALTS